MNFFAEGGPSAVIDSAKLAQRIEDLVTALRKRGPLHRVLVVPPDFTRRHSGAGELTRHLFQKLSPETHVDVLPATGTHRPMSDREIAAMYPSIPADRFLTHDCQRDLITLGEVPASFIREVSEGKLDRPARVEVNRRLVESGYDAIISIGQLVPHEVSGIANYNKNILIGLGGDAMIGLTHFLGAVYGMERIMGRADNPVRAVLNYAADRFLKPLLIVYVLTVRGHSAKGQLVTRGLIAGEDESCFQRGAELCRAVNLIRVTPRPKRIVVRLDAEQYRSTWLANKAIYRTRMAIADGGELIVVAPGVDRFGERDDIDRLIRKYGYRGTLAILKAMAEYADLANNLAAAAHLIHGSTEGRFNVTYCPGHLSRAEIESVGYRFASSPSVENAYTIADPGIGLWHSEPDA